MDEKLLIVIHILIDEEGKLIVKLIKFLKIFIISVVLQLYH